jgi:sporulation protein YlmC with PRC-barrel domain
MLVVAPIEGDMAERGALRAAGTLCGSLVRDRNGEVAGSIAELVLDVERGCVAYAVVATGGFLGVGERRFAVPWTALRAHSRHFVLGVPRAVLESAPTFDSEQCPGAPARAWHEHVHAHFAARRYWNQGNSSGA